jgi:hypothetical protein
VPDNSIKRGIVRFLARRLRFLADRIDHAGAPKATSLTFTFEERTGLVVRDDGRGCRLWYLGDEDYERAHDEAGPVASGSAQVWLPQRLPAGTVLTGRHAEPAWTTASPAFTVTFSTPRRPADG